LMVSSIVNDITNALLVVPPTKNNVVSEEAWSMSPLNLARVTFEGTPKVRVVPSKRTATAQASNNFVLSENIGSGSEDKIVCAQQLCKKIRTKLRLCLNLLKKCKSLSKLKWRAKPCPILATLLNTATPGLLPRGLTQEVRRMLMPTETQTIWATSLSTFWRNTRCITVLQEQEQETKMKTLPASSLYTYRLIKLVCMPNSFNKHENILKLFESKLLFETSDYF
jgi:hypothetical protein